VPLETYVYPDDQSATLPSVWPALVKPTFGDSSVGITQDSVVDCPEALVGRMDAMRSEFPGVPLLIQEFLTGKEYSIGIIGNPGQGFHFLPPLEVDFSALHPELPPILGYESKWLPNSPYWTQISYHEAKLEEETTRRLYDYSSVLFERLGCRDYARFDFRADSNGVIKLLEVNPNPGWCWDGKFNLMAGYSGLRYADLLRLILESAQARYVSDLAGRPNS
jgi:D-alanine-D-alanine ligase